MEAPETQTARADVWKRGLVMLAFIILLGIGQGLMQLLAVVQFLWLLFNNQPNQFLVGFGSSLAEWLAQTGRFLCCATQEKPFPWKPWPNTE